MPTHTTSIFYESSYIYIKIRKSSNESLNQANIPSLVIAR